MLVELHYANRRTWAPSFQPFQPVYSKKTHVANTACGAEEHDRSPASSLKSPSKSPKEGTAKETGR